MDTKSILDQAAPSANGEQEPPAAAPDPFAPDRMRLGQDFTQSVAVKRLVLTVPVRKPAREWFFRVHPDESYRTETLVLELKEDRETYYIDPNLRDALQGETTVGPRAIFTAINRQKVVFLWPVKLPGIDGRPNEWNTSALEAAQRAMQDWVRVEANMSLGAYDCNLALGNLPEPEWPDLRFPELMRIGFKNRFISSLDHPVLKHLRGEA
jgi:hypothetical protein